MIPQEAIDDLARMNNSEYARKYGITHQAAWYRRDKYAKESSRAGRVTPAARARVDAILCSMRPKTRSAPEIAAEVPGVTSQYVRNRAAALKAQLMPAGRAHKEATARRRQIEEMAMAGTPATQIADAVGVHQTYVHHVARRAGIALRTSGAMRELRRIATALGLDFELMSLCHGTAEEAMEAIRDSYMKAVTDGLYEVRGARWSLAPKRAGHAPVENSAGADAGEGAVVDERGVVRAADSAGSALSVLPDGDGQ